MNRPLFTFAITAYNNYKYLFEALESVFIQDYPNIQLIISNDGSSDFNDEELQQYIDAHKPQNIRQVLIKNHAENMGTVRNVEFCRSNAQGEYIMYMAADDALNGSGVLTRFADEFEKLGENALVLTARVAMCGLSLQDIESYEPSEDGIRAIRDMTPVQLFGRLSHTWTIPTTSTCYRKTIYDAVGSYDTDYFIMEDGPLYIKMARMGIKIHWIDDLIAARHRGGGISHGNTLNLSESYRKYRYDEIIFFEKEILPYQELLTPQDRKLMQSKWDYISKAYFETFILPDLKGMEKVKYMLSHLPSVLKTLFRRTKEKAVGWFEDNYLNRNLIVISVLCLFFYVLLAYEAVALPICVAAKQGLMQTCAILMYSSLALSIFLRVMCIVRHIWLTIKYIFSGR